MRITITLCTNGKKNDFMLSDMQVISDAFETIKRNLPGYVQTGRIVSVKEKGSSRWLHHENTFAQERIYSGMELLIYTEGNN